MELKVSVVEVNKLCDSLRKSLEDVVDELEKVSERIDDFLDEEYLDGEAYSNLKEHISDYSITIKSLIDAYRDGEDEATKLKEAVDNKLAPDTELDENLLNDTIDSLTTINKMLDDENSLLHNELSSEMLLPAEERDLQYEQALRHRINANDNEINDNKRIITECHSKIEKLHQLEYSTRFMFEGICDRVMKAKKALKTVAISFNANN